MRWMSTRLWMDPEDLFASTLHVVAAGGGKWIPVADGAWFDDKPRWGPDGRMIYFVSNRSGVPNLWCRRFDPWPWHADR